MTQQEKTDGAVSRRLPFSSNCIKLIAVAAMICDHFSVAFITEDLNLLRWIGRLGFPIFAFLIAEGASRTHNIRRYLLRLFVFALISEIPFDLMIEGILIYKDFQNVYFTLFAGLLSIWILQLLQTKGGVYPLLSISFLFLITVGCECLQTDYSTGGALCIFLFYVALQNRKRKWLYILLLLAALSAPCHYYMSEIHRVIWNWNEVGAFFTLPILLLYNGERGKVRINKYVFYAIYPAHLLLFALIKMFFLVS